MKKVRMFNQAAAKLGFTLIELSIVLVIIGLIVGGILVGQDLIKAAEIRATISQMEKYSTAVNTFRGKYNGLPGDLLNAGNFGFDVGATDGTNGLRDGDGLLESAASTAAQFQNETSCFWDDLTTSGMISDNLNGSTTCDSTAPASVGLGLPVTKLGRGNYILVGSAVGVNYFGISGVSALTTNDYTLSSLLTPSEAFQIDTKLDDGTATNGSVQAVAGVAGTTFWVTGDANSTCVSLTGAYKFGTNSGATQACQLRIRASF
jgi:prepilin-type N-terminal cleavage/methylation domain-containing protein